MSPRSTALPHLTMSSHHAHACFSPPISFSPRCSQDPPATSPSTAHRPEIQSSSESSSTTPVSVVLMRHGMTNWNLAGRVQGGLDHSRLNTIGIRQARQAGLSLRNIHPDRIFCSPLTRARDTLRIAATSSANPAILGKKVDILHNLIEIQVPWQGMLKNEIEQSAFADVYGSYVKNPKRFSYNGYNPIQDIVRRARNVWRTVRSVNGNCHLLVAHNQMNKALICTALGVPPNLSSWRQENCCFNVIVLEENGAKVRLINGGIRRRHTLGSLTSAVPKLRQRSVRVILHQAGGSTALEHEWNVLQGGVQKIYLIGDVQIHELGQTTAKDFSAITMRIKDVPTSSNTELYQFAFGILERVRKNHQREVVIISVEDSMCLRAFFAASLGLGSQGIHKLQSDPGGVSVIDIRIHKPVGSLQPFVEAYNVGAWANPDSLFGYTVLDHNAQHLS